MCAFASSVCYLTGIETIDHFAPTLLLVPASGDPTLLTSDFEAYNVLVSSWTDEVVTFGKFGTPVPALEALLRERGYAGARLGWEQDRWGMSRRFLEGAREGVPARWSVEEHAVEAVMAHKSAEEVAALRRAGAISVAAMRAAMGTIRVGATDNDVAVAIYATLIGGGSEHVALNPIVAVGEHAGIPHANHRRRPIRAGDPVWMEHGACISRYSAPMMRSPVVGRVPDALWERMHAACVAAVERTFALIRPGAVVREVALEATEPLRSLPPDIVTDGGRGYTVGIGFPPSWYDVPGLRIATALSYAGEPHYRPDLRLEPGHVFHVRATTRAVGRFGATVSDTVVVTEGGCEVLTEYPRELKVL